MRIGLFTDTYEPHINGVSTSVAMLKRALEKKNHIVYVVTVNDSAIKSIMMKKIGFCAFPVFRQVYIIIDLAKYIQLKW